MNDDDNNNGGSLPTAATGTPPRPARRFKCDLLFAHGKGAQFLVESRDMVGALAKVTGIVSDQPAKVVGVKIELHIESRIVLARSLPPGGLRG